jgi:hypothetical protein
MSSNIRTKKTCEYCGNSFVAHTFVTRYCSHRCNRLYYKQQLRDLKEELHETGTIESFDVIRTSQHCAAGIIPHTAGRSPARHQQEILIQAPCTKEGQEEKARRTYCYPQRRHQTIRSTITSNDHYENIKTKTEANLQIHQKEPVHLREKKLRNGNLSLYLDKISNGSRSYQFLNLYLKNPVTAFDRAENDATLELAHSIKAEHILAVQKQNNGHPVYKLDYDFMEQFRQMTVDRYNSTNNYGN